MNKKIIVVMSLMVLLFSGCASMWEAVSIGKLESKAEEEGMDYQDTGVVADPYFLYVNRKNIDPTKIYPNADCREGRKEKLLIGDGGDR